MGTIISSMGAVLPMAFDDHIDRIYRSAKLIDIEIPMEKAEMKRMLQGQMCIRDSHLGESEPQRLIFQIAPTNVQHCTWLGF